MHLKVFVKLKKPLKTLKTLSSGQKKPQKNQKNPKKPKKTQKTQKKTKKPKKTHWAGWSRVRILVGPPFAWSARPLSNEEKTWRALPYNRESIMVTYCSCSKRRIEKGDRGKKYYFCRYCILDILS
jgi:hypothetical protein